MNDSVCPKCSSTRINLISAAYPKELECLDCGHMFLQGKQALIDE